ncbi:glutaredoxin family protein [Fodinicurvata sediminis]|uniref:glutaredoxin family protein n=1 Tax=Fodinicurvata sediminis TaxID=1121832 RepID=UPI0003B735D4|nr:glutaredoxin family protein [Fodinicurvata sediminis]
MAQSRNDSGAQEAALYRMVMEDHVCPFGLKAKDLLERAGYSVADHWLTTREETDAFQDKHDVETTPQVFIGGARVGGYDELRVHLGKDSAEEAEDETSYKPIIALFSLGLLMALAVSHVALDTLVSLRTLELFIAISMCLLGLQKLQDVEGFSTMFLNYDLLAQRQVRYAYFYPFAETAAGVLMIAGVLIWIAAPLALFIGAVGAASVFKAVYIDKRELKCACVGGSSKVPLGFISLTENLMMVLMALWMPLRMFVLG